MYISRSWRLFLLVFLVIIGVMGADIFGSYGFITRFFLNPSENVTFYKIIHLILIPGFLH